MNKAQLKDSQSIRNYLFAGRATFTLVSHVTNTRYTYRVCRAEGDYDGRPWFVSVLVGSDNERSYAYVGCIFPDKKKLVATKKSKVAKNDARFIAVAWLLDVTATAAELTDKVAFWHSGKCGRCNRKLTVPESIASGLGPVCAGLLN